MLLKVDMSKAYDRLSWGFIIHVLDWYGFSPQFCNLIYHAISNCWYSVLWGGRSFGFFKSNRGVRQGDPLSSCLFILSMNVLSLSLNAAVAERKIATFGSAPIVHHLLFADDLLIFTNAKKVSFKNLLDLFNGFCRMSGQQINQSKSSLFFSKWIVGSRKKTIMDMSGFREGFFPTQYLGAPLFPGRAKIIYFKAIEDNIRKRVNSWAKNMLSMAGRTTLIQSVLNSIPIHNLAVLPIPTTCIKRIQSLIRNFLWDRGASSKKHWINWKSVCLPKDEGGLGLRTIQDVKNCCLGKMAWAFLRKDNLWSIFARARYNLEQNGSSLFRSVKPWIVKLRRESYWDIREGNTTINHFCEWLQVSVPGHLHDLSLRQVVEDVVLRGELLSSIPPVMHGLFEGMQFSDGPDVLLWRRSSNGVFDNKGFHEAFRCHKSKNSSFKAIWQSWIPPKVSILAWKVLHNILPTDENIRKWGISMASVCSCCTLPSEESSKHLMFDSDIAKRVWAFLATVFDKSPPSNASQLARLWFQANEKDPFMHNLKVSLVGCALWEIWLYRNHIRMEGKMRNPIRFIKKWALDIHLLVKGSFKDTLSLRSSLGLLGIPIPSQSGKFGLWKRWSPFHSGLTLSVSIISKVGEVFAGGVIRDHQRRFISASRIRITDICLFEGILQLTQHLRHLDVRCIQSDSECISCMSSPNRSPPLASRASWTICMAKLSKVAFELVREEHNIPANIIAYNGVIGSCISWAHIPKSMKVALAGDNLHCFCQEQNGS